MKRKILIAVIAVLIATIMNSLNQANAESLFVLSASQQNSPRSLFSGVRAMGIGDLVSIVVEENLNTTDTMTYNSNKSSSTTDNFTTVLKKWIPFSLYKIDSPDQYGGQNTVGNSANQARTLTMGDRISAQVVQMLSNGNLIVQGKKTLVNNNERLDLVVTGVVDPRWINASGEISSRKVANLQFAVSGRGSLSRGQNEGIINRFIKYLF